MSNQPSQKKQLSPLKKQLTSLVAVGFVSGLFAMGTVWFYTFSQSPSRLLLTMVLGLVSLTFLLAGVRVYASIALSLARNEQKHLQNALTQAKDMLDTNKELRDDHVLLQTLIQNLPHPVWLKDRFGRYLVANQVFVQQWCNGAEVKGKTDAELLNETLADTFADADKQAMDTAVPNKLELRMDMKDQPSRWVRIERYALRSEEQKPVGVLGFAIDISHYKDAQKANDIDGIDPITLLKNHASLMAKVATDTELTKQVICLQIDIDHFRVMNDSLGTEAGNQILIKVAERLLKASKPDDFVARISADEFIVIWRHDGQDNAQSRIHDLHQSIDQPVVIGERHYSFTSSIGATKSPEHGDTYQELLRSAGVALFNAKKLGRNQIHWYHDDYIDQATRRLNKEQLLRQAVTNHQFEVHAQPRIDCRTGNIEAIECLVRIQADDGSLIYPTKFIELAEQNGLIKNIDAFMIQTAFSQIESWLEQGVEPLPLAINLSIISVNDDLMTLLEHWQKKNAAIFDFIEFELTEHGLPENDPVFLKHLHNIRQYGITLVLDDFGTGYANLSRLPDWPFQILKMDSTFILGLLESIKQQTVVKSVVDLCNALNIHVVAEGVEEDAELTMVNNLGCHSIQGFVYEKPRPLADIDHWLKQRKLNAQ